MSRPLGSVVSLHRYPVKSMRGEDLEAVEVTPRGVLGDRAYALVDRSTGHIVSGKRPKKWRGILDIGASFLAPPSVAAPTPEVRITFPDGTEVASEERARAEEKLSETLGRSVALASVPPEGASFEYHWPDMEGLVYQGRTYRDEITRHEMPPGTFFDGATLLLLTTSSLARLATLAPGSDFDPRRFRPNIVIDPASGHSGFVENDWVGSTLAIGDARIEITKRCLRCVMVTSAQNGLPKDPGVLRAAFDHNEGNVGVSGAVAAAGRIKIGDVVRLA